MAKLFPHQGFVIGHSEIPVGQTVLPLVIKYHNLVPDTTRFYWTLGFKELGLTVVVPTGISGQ